MDLKGIGLFLAELRRDRGLTQEELGEKLGVTNKTVSRWENGNYLPPAEMLRELSMLYGVTINELLSGERLTETQYRERAEENITAVIKAGGFSRQERLAACGTWLRRYWWAALLCLLPAVLGYSLLPRVVGGAFSAAMLVTSLLALALILVTQHILHYVCKQAYGATNRLEEFRALRIWRTVWLLFLSVSLFVTLELLLATLYAMTPAGTADGYGVSSMFYDILIADGGDYLNNCYLALRRSAWQSFGAVLVNIDLTILWMRRK